MKNQPPFITFVTVVFNGVNELEHTIQSILQQSNKDFEYFIIDGGSTDGTIDLIRKYEAQLAGWISEPDHGLYDAMNKGMKLGIGKYLWFMNAGDLLHSNDTVQKIIEQIRELPDLIYGESEVINERNESIGMRRLKAPEHLDWKSLQWGMVVCHQSFLVKRDKCLSYDLAYRFSSDVDWMIRVLKNSQQIFNTHLVLCKFKTGGLSQKNIVKGLKERYRIMTIHYGLLKTTFNHFILGTKFIFYYLLHGRL